MHNNQLQGNWGEQFVAMQLSANNCLIRHVTQGHDCGIDLYCEFVKESIPYISFACQIKTSYKFTDLNSIHSQCKSLINPHLGYWLNQPIPVYIFFIPSSLKESDSNFPYYFCNVLDFKQKNKSENNYIKTIEKNEELRNYLNYQLSADVFKWGLKNGNINFLKTPKETYLKQIPTSYTNQFGKEIDQALLNTILLRTYSLRDSEDNLIDKFVNTLEILLPQLDKKTHYHYYDLLGDYYSKDGKSVKKAIENYYIALSILKTDSNTVNSSLISEINSKIENLKNNKILRNSSPKLIPASSADILA